MNVIFVKIIGAHKLDHFRKVNTTVPREVKNLGESPCLPIVLVRDRLEPGNGQGRPKATWGKKFTELQQTCLLISCLIQEFRHGYEIPSCKLYDFHRHNDSRSR